jgi:hypothetical protein
MPQVPKIMTMKMKLLKMMLTQMKTLTMELWTSWTYLRLYHLLLNQLFQSKNPERVHTKADLLLSVLTVGAIQQADHLDQTSRMTMMMTSIDDDQHRSFLDDEPIMTRADKKRVHKFMTKYVGSRGKKTKMRK